MISKTAKIMKEKQLFTMLKSDMSPIKQFKKRQCAEKCFINIDCFKCST